MSKHYVNSKLKGFNNNKVTQNKFTYHKTCDTILTTYIYKAYQ